MINIQLTEQELIEIINAWDLYEDISIRMLSFRQELLEDDEFEELDKAKICFLKLFKKIQSNNYSTKNLFNGWNLEEMNFND